MRSEAVMSLNVKFTYSVMCHTVVCQTGTNPSEKLSAPFPERKLLSGGSRFLRKHMLIYQTIGTHVAETKQAGVALMVWTCIREVLVSNVARDTEYSERSFPWFSGHGEIVQQTHANQDQVGGDHLD
jgi:hypothetical protein